MTSAGRVAARNQLPRRDKRRTTVVCVRKLRLGQGGRRRAAPRESVLKLPKLLGPGKAQNAGPTESAPLWRTREPEPERLRPGKCTPHRARSLESSLEPEQCRRGKHVRHERGKPSVAGTLRVLPTQVSDICLQRPSLPAARLNKPT